jgi:hypothetical protein
MSVAFLPYGRPRNHFCDLGSILFDDVEWPLNDRPEGNRLADLRPTDHILGIASSRFLTIRRKSLACPLSVLIGEPPAIQRRLYRAIRWRAGIFRYVMTHNTGLLQSLGNAHFVAHGGSMISDIEQPRIPKTHRVSMIASDKKSTTGHRLRHAIAEWALQCGTDFHALGRGYRPLEEKADGHNPYFFSVVIENSREPGYFTEKLIDSFLCHSIPIYWGAPDIEHFFDPRGMINCSSPEEIKKAVANLTAEHYCKREPYLARNREIAMRYTDLFGRAARRVHDLDTISCDRLSAAP